LVEEREMAEVRTRPERRDLATVALDLDLAVDQHETLSTDISLFHEGAPLGDLHLVRRASDALQILARARAEHRHASQVLEVRVPPDHSKPPHCGPQRPPRSAQSVRAMCPRCPIRGSAGFTLAKQPRNTG